MPALWYNNQTRGVGGVRVERMFIWVQPLPAIQLIWAGGTRAMGEEDLDGRRRIRLACGQSCGTALSCLSG